MSSPFVESNRRHLRKCHRLYRLVLLAHGIPIVRTVPSTSVNWVPRWAEMCWVAGCSWHLWGCRDHRHSSTALQSRRSCQRNNGTSRSGEPAQRVVKCSEDMSKYIAWCCMPRLALWESYKIYKRSKIPWPFLLPDFLSESAVHSPHNLVHRIISLGSLSISGNVVNLPSGNLT